MKIYRWCFIIGLLTFTLVASANCAWYSNGNLHNSSVKQWKQASKPNQISTAADWALKCPKIKEKVLKSGTMDTLKPFALSLVNCLKQTTAGQGYDYMSSSEIAAACMISMGWLK